MLSSWGVTGEAARAPSSSKAMTASQRGAQFKNANRIEARHLLVSHPALGKGRSFSMLVIG